MTGLERFAGAAEELQSLIHALSFPENNTPDNINRYNEILSDQDLAAGAFCYLIENEDIVNDQIIIGLNRALESKTIDPELIEIISESMLKSFEKISMSQQVTTFVNSICAIYSIREGDWPELISFIHDEISDDHIKAEFIVRLINDISFFDECRDIIYNFSLSCIKSEDPNMWIFAITIITFAASVDEENDYSEHIQCILVRATNSIKLDKSLFTKLWTEISNFLEIVNFSDDSIIMGFEKAIDVAANADKFSASDRCIVLNSLIPIIRYLDEDYNNVKDYLENSLLMNFNVAKKLLEETRKLPHDAFDLFEAAADRLYHEDMYSFLKDLLKNSLESSDDLCSFVVAFCIANKIFNIMPLKFRDDWDFFDNIFKMVNESEEKDDLVLTCICEMIINMKKTFQKQLINNCCYLDITVPLIVSENKDLNHVALNAAFEAMNAVDVPVSGAVEKVWSINEEIGEMQIESYLTLLGKAIGAERDISDQFIEDIVPSIGDWLSSEDSSVMTGALKLAVMIMVESDIGYGNLIEIIREFINTILVGDVESELKEEMTPVVLFTLNALIKEKPSLFVEYFGSEIIEELAGSIDQYGIQDKESIAEILARSLTVFSELSLSQRVLSQIIQENYTNFSSSLFDNIVLKCLPIACNEIMPDVLSNAVVELCKDVRRFKDKELVMATMKCLSGVFHNYKGEDLAGLIESAHSLVSDFANGAILICAGKPPLMGDPDIDLIMDAGTLFSELFNAPSDNNQPVIDFINQLLNIEDEDLNDIAISIAAGIAEAPMVSEDVINYCKEIAHDFFKVESDTIFYQNTCALVIALLERSVKFQQEVDIDFLEDPVSVLGTWWSNCVKEWESMRESSDNIAILVWILAVRFEIEFKWISNTFSTIPPSDPSDTALMAELIVEGKHLFANSTDAIYRLFTRGKSKLLKDDVSNEIITALASIYLENTNEAIQAAHTNQYGEYALTVISQNAQ